MPGRGRWGRCPSGRAQPTGARSRRDVGHSSARTERLPQRPPIHDVPTHGWLTGRSGGSFIPSASMRSSSARKISSCSAIAASRAGSEAAAPVRSCPKAARAARTWECRSKPFITRPPSRPCGALSDPDAPVAGPMEHPRGDSPLVAGSRGQDQFEHAGGDAVLDLPEVKLRLYAGLVSLGRLVVPAWMAVPCADALEPFLSADGVPLVEMVGVPGERTRQLFRLRTWSASGLDRQPLRSPPCDTLAAHSQPPVSDLHGAPARSSRARPASPSTRGRRS